VTHHPTQPARTLIEWDLTEGERELRLEYCANLGQTGIRLACEQPDVPPVLVTASLTAVPLPQETTVHLSEYSPRLAGTSWGVVPSRSGEGPYVGLACGFCICAKA